MVCQKKIYLQNIPKAEKAKDFKTFKLIVKISSCLKNYHQLSQQIGPNILILLLLILKIEVIILICQTRI